MSLARAGYKRNSKEDEIHKHVCIITFVQDTLLIQRFSATTCTNKTYIWVELQVVLILGKLIKVFEVHGLINNQQTGDAMSRPHAKLSIQDNTK